MSFRVRFAVLAASLFAGGAIAAPPAASPSEWAQTPTTQQSAAVKPAGAGIAMARCKVAADESLSDCRLILENPSGAGFGRAVLSLAPQYRMKPAAEGGVAPGGEVVIFKDWLAIDKPADWLRKPTAQDLLTVWPKDAWAHGMGGKAVISCLVNAQGALFDCVVESESPAGAHFGDAAVALTPQLLFRPATLKGQPVVSAVTIPFKFEMPAGAGPRSNFGSRATVRPDMAWVEAPSYSQVAAAYPKKARDARLGGRATLYCDFGSDSKLSHCDTLQEEPKGDGFAEAAKALAKRFRAPPLMADGKPIRNASVQLPFAFDPSMLTDAAPAIGKAKWAGLPSGEDTAQAFAAVTKSTTGAARAVLTCVVQTGGTVSDCKVESEEPAGQGVGQAALTLAPHFRLTTWTTEGLPTVGARVTIPLRYEPGSEGAANP
ncbi:MAG: TonB family protein [Phenylobacterium sp.]